VGVLPQDREGGPRGEPLCARLHALAFMNFGYFQKKDNRGSDEKKWTSAPGRKKKKKRRHRYIRGNCSPPELPSLLKIFHMSTIRTMYVLGFVGYSVTIGHGGGLGCLSEGRVT
jgi:hypothetical protein